jgi:hypothetical protein
VRIVIICPFVGLEIDMELPEENRDVLEALDSLWARAEELLDRGLWTPSEAIRQEYHAMAAAVPPNRRYGNDSPENGPHLTGRG